MVSSFLFKTVQWPNYGRHLWNIFLFVCKWHLVICFCWIYLCFRRTKAREINWNTLKSWIATFHINSCLLLNAQKCWKSSEDAHARHEYPIKCVHLCTGVKDIKENTFPGKCLLLWLVLISMGQDELQKDNIQGWAGRTHLQRSQD